MKISILHLSDIHFKSSEDSIFKKLNKIFDAVKNNVKLSTALVIVLTGDIANTGSKEEYRFAEIFLDQIYRHFVTLLGKGSVFIITTPGNHDCDFSGDTAIRDLVIEKILSDFSMINQQYIKNCLEVQKNYRSFADKYCNEINEIIPGILHSISHEIGRKKIVFHCYNSAWMSKKNEEIGKLVFPTNLDYKHLSIKNADLTVSLMHHPLNWFNHLVSKELGKIQKNTSNIILTGHEHLRDEYLLSDLKGNSTEFLAGGVLQGTDPNQSCFKLIEINLDDNRQTLLSFEWSPLKIIYERAVDFEDTAPYTIAKHLILSSDYIKKINYPGVAFTHPNKPELFISDYFIFPDLEDIKNKDKNSNIVPSINVCIRNNLPYTKSIIFGDDSSGKTTFASQCQININRDGRVPIYIHGSEIDINKLKKIEKLIEKKFSQQYNKKDLEIFRQLDIDSCVIIIDDITHCKFNLKYMANLIRDIESKYRNLIIICSSELELELEVSSELNMIFSKYNQFKIKEFGHSKRDEIIEKWIKIGRAERLSLTELHNEKARYAKIINTTIGNNFIPKYPIFVLTLLQAFEAGNVKLQGSSYGHYYHYLISQSLGLSGVKHNELHLYFNYLSCLAFHCFDNNIHEVSHSDMCDFHKLHCDELEIDAEFSKTFDILKKAKLILHRDDHYKFNHNYVYYYFVAQYLSENITNDHILSTVENISKRLYITELANILIFLVHHSNTQIIIDLVLNEAGKLFNNLEFIKLNQNEISNINKLIVNEVKLQIADRPASENRKDMLKEFDSIDIYKKEYEGREKYIISDDIKELNLISKINLAFKIMDIIGHITKNYYGSINGENKYFLIEETFMLGLRSLRALLSEFESNTDLIVDMLIEITDSTKVREQRIRNLVFQIAAFFTVSFISKCATSMASKNLNISLNKVFKANNEISFDLVKIAIELSFPNGLNSEKIYKLYQKLKKNRLSQTVLKLLVISHLYMFDVNYKVKASVCSLLGISTRGKINLLKQKDSTKASK